ncbi:hypothetical protein LGQ02_17355 [Bacillus shivajii]|nr:hypothetical protein LGQ02_17355 [Bacillus shivajii]
MNPEEQDERVFVAGRPGRRPPYHGRRPYYPAPFIGGVLGGLLGSALFPPYYYYPPFPHPYPPYYYSYGPVYYW